MQLAAGVEQRFAQAPQVASSIRSIESAGETMVAALDNVLRNTGQVESRLSGHCLRMGVGASQQ